MIRHEGRAVRTRMPLSGITVGRKAANPVRKKLIPGVTRTALLVSPSSRLRAASHTEMEMLWVTGSGGGPISEHDALRKAVGAVRDHVPPPRLRGEEGRFTPTAGS